MESRPATAEALLRQVQFEPLQSLLNSVRSATYPPGSVQIPELDAHFFSTVRHHASPLSSLNRGDVIEIQGPACSGKSHLLYHLLITCIMPTQHAGCELGGWGMSATVFDTENSFDILRFRHLTVLRVASILTGKSSVPVSLDEENLSKTVKDIADHCLSNLHIFTPTSSLQLAATILHLPAYHCTHMPDSEIGLVAVDSLGAYYWLDRYNVEQKRTMARSSSLPTPHTPSITNPLVCVLAALQRLRLSHGPVIAYTNWGLQPVSVPQSNVPQQQGPFYKQHLYPVQSPFAESSINATASASGVTIFPLTHHITLSPILVLPFPHGISRASAREQEEKYRQQVTSKGEVRAIVRTVGSTLCSNFTFSGIPSDS